ncbi:beta-lactamase-like protein [Ochromonadaceae sp. CCMP2298]|nr:beta-lactamase-like protein [Ochromonadaceae sp. CCMP2298]|eukprot:CAMPEP_0173192618 /NCGR_PEP_ID=MMETSP1141-20130122/13517_1 /TAXON_ID=483371 /ORGANISM="non described non described, Strain CCMP2298" /LENGTH=262 /DNA_ID=CAMNT_0014116891 /DNA_START=108 /DNA_END=896 /DNA_ORIENTATION=+
MRVITVPLNSDNYGYLLVCDKSRTCAVVDVSSQPQTMLQEVRKLLGFEFTTIFTTHKHWDHAGGNEAMLAAYPDLTIYAGRQEGAEAANRLVDDGEELLFGAGIKVKCLLTPGHTMGHICYYMEEGEGGGDAQTQRLVFTGDTLFAGGVGKFFEGTAADMHPSLCKLAQLPGDSLVYCGHEYTLSNYKFALSVDPHNTQLQEAHRAAVLLRADDLPTIPSSIQKELDTNPFLRVHCAGIQQSFPGLSPQDTLAAVREAKNSF